MTALITILILNFQTAPPTVQSTSTLLQNKFGYSKDKIFLLVNIQKQELYVVRNDAVEKTYHISSSKYGTGNRKGSEKTPLGVHRVAEKIGAGAKPNTIFIGRKNTGEVTAIIKDSLDVEEDKVTSRILWLEGLEKGINKGKGIDSHDRFIYIHGTQEEGLIGTPASHGCIRLYNKDVIELFDLIGTGTLVVIAEQIQ